MAKRDIKARRWARRRTKRTTGLILYNYRGYLIAENIPHLDDATQKRINRRAARTLALLCEQR